MRRDDCLLWLAIAAIAAIMLAGCEAPTPDNQREHAWWVEKVDVDGRQVPCIFWASYDVWSKQDASGMSCDWSLK